MEDIQEKEKLDALSYARCTKLPRSINPEQKQNKIWIFAIAKIRKITGANSFAIVRNDYGRKPRVIKVFGECAAIAEIVSIHPYRWLRQECIPQFASEAEKNQFIADAYDSTIDKVVALSQENRDRLLYMNLMDRQEEYDKAESI